MSAAEILTEEAPLKRHRFTVEEYYAMGESGILAPDARVELIDGEIIERSPIGNRHAAMVMRLNSLLNDTRGSSYQVSPGHPAILGKWSAPEPDLMLLKPRADFYESAHPTIADMLLVIEVSDSTLRQDRGVKKRLYAEFAIPEYWIVNLVENRIEVHREPSAAGYGERVVVGPGESFGPLCAASLGLQYEQVFPASAPNG